MNEECERVANTVVVVIHADGSVDPIPIGLSKGRGDCIVWVSESDDACDVVFQDGHSPFKEHTFRVEGRNWKHSGALRSEVAEGDSFHFDSKRAGQTMAADPDVIIRK